MTMPDEQRFNLGPEAAPLRSVEPVGARRDLQPVLACANVDADGGGAGAAARVRRSG